MAMATEPLEPTEMTTKTSEEPQDSLSGTATRENVVKQAAIHNALMVEAATKKAEKSATPSAFAQASRAAIELEIMALQARLAVLNDLSGMTEEEKMLTLFRVLDKNRDGSLSVTELADGLRKIHGDVMFEESIGMALERVAHFDVDGDAKLQYSEFQEYVTQLCGALGSSFHDLAEMLLLSVVFSETGNDAAENLVAAVADEEITQGLLREEALSRVMGDNRMKLLFEVFDTDMDGTVDLVEVAMGIYKIKNDLDEAAATAVSALLFFDDDGNSVLDYEEFTRFILQLVSAMGQTFDEAVFNLTKAAAEEDQMTKEELMEKLSSSGTVEKLDD